jgi:hypothetical protein
METIEIAQESTTIRSEGRRHRQYPCSVCGAIGNRRYCAAHDPNRLARERAHAQRAAAYRAKAGAL